VLNRRHFLSTATTGIAASLARRGNLFAQLEKTPPLPDHSLLDKNEDAYWAEMRKQFIIPDDEVYLNNGTVGSSPAPVLRAIFDGYTTTEKMEKRAAESWTSPTAALRCAIVSVNVPPIQRTDLENRLWKTHKIRIRGGDPPKLRLSTPYHLQKKDVDRFLAKFDEYKKEKRLA
jgi:hypothetical protein